MGGPLRTVGFVQVVGCMDFESLWAMLNSLTRDLRAFVDCTSGL